MKSLYWFQTVLVLLLLSSHLAALPTQIGGYNVYYGSLHSHCEISDGTGTANQAYNFAKNSSHLDFFGLADHSYLIDEIEWTAMKTAADAYNEPGVFTSFRGFEWTTYAYGHVTVVNSADYCKAEPPVYLFTDLCNWLDNRECIAFFNHPGYANKEDKEFMHFATPPSNKFIGIELWNDVKDFSAYYYNDGYFPNDGNKGYFDEALIRNWRIGALGSEDNHSGTWGSLNDFRMAILANANTREELYSALKAKRFYSTLDKNLALSFQINGNEMGSTVLPGTYGVRIRASDADSELFTHIQLINNGTVVNTWTPNSQNPDITSTITFANNQYYYVKVKQTDGNEAISSPIWISNANQFPIISILSPTANQVFLPPATIPISVSASDNDGTVSTVDFYQGSTFLGSDNTSPFSFNWTNVAAGNYTLTAKATDNSGATTVSTPVTIIVTAINQPPVVTLTSPESGATFTAPATIILSASATDADGTITKVEFYYGSNLITSDNTSLYSYTVSGVPASNYTLTARATDNKGSSTTSAPVTISVIVSSEPVVNITSPVSGATFTAPASVTITASASDADGIAKVDFYHGGALLGSDNTSPYSFTWTNVANGSYTLTAKAVDNSGASKTSNPVVITVGGSNQPPVVSITTPLQGASFTSPATVTLVASATDNDGTVSKVDFYYGSTLLGTDNTSPYSYTATNVGVGNYTISAKATDNAGAYTLSQAVDFSVIAESEEITFTKSIQTGSDDVEERATGVISLNNDDIELVYDNYFTGNQIVGLRFNGVTVPQGAIVTSAFIRFTVDETDNGTCNLVIKGEKSGNAQQFTTASKNVSNRTKTTASVVWNPLAWQTIGANQLTPNLESIVQDIISSAVWNSGNSMVFIITGSGTRTAESYEGGSAKAALLTINYSVNTLKSGKLDYRAESIPKIETTINPANFKCYPVPFTHELHIEFIPGEGEYIRNIEVLNSIGNCVMYTMQNENQSVMDMQNLTPGVYIVRIRSNLGIYNKVVLKN